MSLLLGTCTCSNRDQIQILESPPIKVNVKEMERKTAKKEYKKLGAADNDMNWKNTFS